MSVPHFVKRAQRLAAEQAAAELADARREQFLRALDECEIEVTDWEAKFLDGFLKFTAGRPRDPWRWWTRERRAAVDRMTGKYPGV